MNAPKIYTYRRTRKIYRNGKRSSLDLTLKPIGDYAQRPGSIIRLEENWFWKGCKPSFVCSEFLRRRESFVLAASTRNLPAFAGLERAAPGFLFGLAPDGVFRAASLTLRAVRSYRTFSPLPQTNKLRRSNFLWHFPSGQLALSPPEYIPGLTGVTRHRALWSSDFPLQTQNKRSRAILRPSKTREIIA